MMVEQQLVRRILALVGVAHAALLDGKKPQAFQRLQDEILALRRALRQRSDV